MCMSAEDPLEHKQTNALESEDSNASAVANVDRKWHSWEWLRFGFTGVTSQSVIWAFFFQPICSDTVTHLLLKMWTLSERTMSLWAGGDNHWSQNKKRSLTKSLKTRGGAGDELSWEGSYGQIRSEKGSLGDHWLIGASQQKSLKTSERVVHATQTFTGWICDSTPGFLLFSYTEWLMDK